jgi:hypothetical protein
MEVVTNPMCTVAELTRRVTGRYTDSRDADYVKVYRLLERMTRDGVLLGISTKNGGNVYMLKERSAPPIRREYVPQRENHDELPF